MAPSVLQDCTTQFCHQDAAAGRRGTRVPDARETENGAVETENGAVTEPDLTAADDGSLQLENDKELRPSPVAPSVPQHCTAQSCPQDTQQAEGEQEYPMPAAMEEQEYSWSPALSQRVGEDVGDMEISRLDSRVASERLASRVRVLTPLGWCFWFAASAVSLEGALSPHWFLRCVLPRGERAQAMLDAQFPRQHLVQFLSAGFAPASVTPASSTDRRLPADPKILPSKVVQVLDDKFLFSILLSILFSVVSFAPPQLCLNAKFRMTGWQSLRPSHEDAETKPPQLTAAIKEITGRLARFKEDVKEYQKDYAAATFKKLVSQINMMGPDRASIQAFSCGSSEYAPASVKIVGIFKTIRDEMSKDFADTTAVEKAAVASYGDLITERTKEVKHFEQEDRREV